MSEKIHIGVLSLQGSVCEHTAMLKKIKDIEPIEVKSLEALKMSDGLILPGGESTTISKLLHDFGLFSTLRKRIENGMPVWGTCAGMILLAKNIVGEKPHLGVMDITVRRNAYGRQIDSFEEECTIPSVSKQKIPLVFIRAPWIENAGENVDILCRLKGHIVAAKEKNILVTSFHPELTDCTLFHQYFVKMVKEAENQYKNNMTALQAAD